MGSFRDTPRASRVLMFDRRCMNQGMNHTTQTENTDHLLLSDAFYYISSSNVIRNHYYSDESAVQIA